MTPDPSTEAVRQLRLRHRLTAATCEEYFGEGFTVIAQDVILGDHLADMVHTIQQRPLLVAVLAPRPDWVQAWQLAPSTGESWPQLVILTTLIPDEFWPHLLVSRGRSVVHLSVGRDDQWAEGGEEVDAADGEHGGERAG
jgi:hypothetical protein